MLDFQKLDPFWNLWSKPNPGISSKMLQPARFFCNFERQIGHEIFVKTEKTEYLSNQLTFAHFNRKFIFPMKIGTSEQIFIFLDFQMFQISGTVTVKAKLCRENIFLLICCLFMELQFSSLYKKSVQSSHFLFIYKQKKIKFTLKTRLP